MKDILYTVTVLVFCRDTSAFELLGGTIDLNLTDSTPVMVGGENEFNISTFNSVTFSLKSCAFVRIKLTKEYTTHSQKYMIVLGRCNNDQSIVKDAGGTIVSIKNEQDVLNCDEFGLFHIMWNDAVLSVFKLDNGTWNNYICLENTSPDVIAFVSVKNPNTYWRFYKQEQNLSLTLNETDCPGYISNTSPSTACPVYTTTTQATTTLVEETTTAEETTTVEKTTMAEEMTTAEETTTVPQTAPVGTSGTTTTTTTTTAAPLSYCYKDNVTYAGNNTVCSLVCEKNYTSAEITSLIEQLKKELTIDKTQSNKYIRTKTSASDSRPSSAVIGFMGGAILIALGVGLLILDLPNLIQSFQMLKKLHCPCFGKTKVNP